MTSFLFDDEIFFGVPAEGKNGDEDGEEHLDDENSEAEADTAVGGEADILGEGHVGFEVTKTPNAGVGKMAVHANGEVHAARDDEERENNVEKAKEI